MTSYKLVNKFWPLYGLCFYFTPHSYRFQILRELLPHNDQKRDKATFLLEVRFQQVSCFIEVIFRSWLTHDSFVPSFLMQVIEYIRFLQEKVQKYEATFPEWNQENAKMLPWVIASFSKAAMLATAVRKGTVNSWLCLNVVLHFCSQICIFDHSGKMHRQVCVAKNAFALLNR